MHARLGFIAVCLLIAAWTAPAAGAAGSTTAVRPPASAGSARSIAAVPARTASGPIGGVRLVGSPASAVRQATPTGFSFRHIVYRLSASSRRVAVRRWELRLRMTEQGKGVKGAAVVFKLAHGKILKAGKTSGAGWAQREWPYPGHGAARITYLAKHYSVRLGITVNAIGDPTMTVTSLDTDQSATLTGMALPGSTITVSGTGFTAGEVVHVYLDTAQNEIATGVAEPATGTAPGQLDPIQALLPQTIVPAQHTIIAVGQTSGAGGTAGLLVFTPWDGLRGGLLSSQNESLLFNQINYGTRAQTLEHDMSPDRMAGGTLVTLKETGEQTPCAASSTLSAFATNAFITGSGPVSTYTDPCYSVFSPQWTFNSNAGLGQSTALGRGCAYGGIGASFSTPLDLAGVILQGGSDGRMYGAHDMSNINACSALSNFPVASTSTSPIEASPEAVYNSGDGELDVAIADQNGRLGSYCFAQCPTSTGTAAFPPVRIGDGSAIVSTPLSIAAPNVGAGTTSTNIYVADADGYFQEVNASTGSIVKGVTLGGSTVSSPVSYNNRIYVAGASTVFCYTLSLSACPAPWTNFATGGTITTTPAIAHGVLYITSQDNNIYAINALTGAENWRSPLPVAAPTGGVPFNSSPAYVDGGVYVGGTDGGLYGFYASTGGLIPGFPQITSASIYSSPAIGQGAIVFSSADGSQWELLPAPHGWGDSGAEQLPSSADAVHALAATRASLR